VSGSLVDSSKDVTETTFKWKGSDSSFRVESQVSTFEILCSM